MNVQKISHAVLWYFFWFLLISVIYWPGFGAMPQRDHTFFMLGRHLEASDTVWLVKSLAFSRTNILLPGDYFTFRPLHMFVIALNDILFRYNFTIQAIVCCSIASLTATSFFVLAKRITGFAVAGALTFFWIFQLVGAEVVLWKHITPFLLMPGLFCFSLLLLTNKQVTLFAALKAGFWVLLASLTHEAGCTIALMVAGLLLLVKNMEAVRRRTFISVFAIPPLSVIFINAFDYFVMHPPPSGWVTPKGIPADTLSGFAHSLLSFMGSMGIAFFSPSLLNYIPETDGFFYWPIWELPITMLTGYAILMLFVIIIFVWRICRHAFRAESSTDVVLLFSLALFINSLGMAVVRVFSRGLPYMADAGHHYSMILLSICGMSLVGVIYKPVTKLNIRLVAAVVMILGVWQVTELRSQLAKAAPAIQSATSDVKRLRGIYTSSTEYCFDGIDVTQMPMSWWPNSALLYDVSCANRPGSLPTYVSYENNVPVLAVLASTRASIIYKPLAMKYEQRIDPEDKTKSQAYFTGNIPFGYPVDFYLPAVNSFNISFKTENSSKFGFKINHNVITAFNSIYTNNYSFVFDKSSNPKHYSIEYAYNNILLYVNGKLVNFVNVDRSQGEMYSIDISSKSVLLPESIQNPRVSDKIHMDNIFFRHLII